MTAEPPSIAVVIPAYKQGTTLAETIESVLAQKTARAVRVVLVNDGCPTATTDDVCRVYQRTRPDAVSYLRQRNRGLAGARNAGASVALAAWPSVRSLLFLDADDRIWPTFLDRACDLLEETPEVGWVYPNLALFGDAHGYVDFAGEYSILRHLADNYCAAPSLVRRSVFDAGIRYEDSPGWEDWDFWLQCLEAGFRGRHLNAPALSYRVRPGSMLRSSGAYKQGVIQTLRKRHEKLFRPANFLETEQRERPRFALCLTGRQVVFTTDPRSSIRQMSLERFVEDVSAGVRLGRLDRLPSIVLIANGAQFDQLNRLGVMPGLLWQFQLALESTDVVAAHVEFEHSHDVRLAWASWNQQRNAGLGFQLIALRAGLLGSSHGSGVASRLQDLAGVPPTPRTALWSVTVGSPDLDTIQAPPVEASLSHLEHLVSKALLRGREAFSFGSRPRAENPPNGGEELARLMFEAPAPFPVVEKTEGPRIGWLFDARGGFDSLCSIRGMASAGRALGWSSHLFVCGSSSATLSSEQAAAFDSVTLIRPELVTSKALVSLLCPMHVVVSAGCSRMVSSLGRLKDLGVQVLAFVVPGGGVEPDTEEDWYDQVIRAETALAGFVALSKGLRARLIGRGIPEDKVLAIPSGPALVVEGDLATRLRDLKRSSQNRDLRVLLLHEVDDRPALDLRQALLARMGASGPALELLCAPHRSSSVGELRDLVWSDVVVLAGRRSASGATIRLAQDMGCLVLTAAFVDAEEFIVDGVTGWLYPSGARVEETADWICKKLDGLKHPDGPLSMMPTERSRESDWGAAARSLDQFISGTTSA